ncbi:MAG: phage tail protein [Ornithinimicrobium sp.]
MADRDGSPDTETATTCWSVSIDIHNLGTFISCDGLGMEVVLEQREEGGNNGFVWQIPTRVKFSNIKLSRPVGADTPKIMNWLAGMALQVTPQNATISALTAKGTPVATWNLMEVVPVRWTGPSFSADSPKVATETIELAHHGFTKGAPAT